MPGIRTAVSASMFTVAVLGGTLTATPALGAAPTRYVALGDSYASGLGTRDYTTESGSCRRSPEAYPQLWSDAHQVADFTFAACAGATIDDVLSNQVGSVRQDTSLVTVTAGGNDVGFVQVISTCLLGNDAACDSAVSAGETKIRDELPAKLGAVYQKIRSAAPHATVIVVGYPRLNTLGQCDIPGYDDTKRARINAGADLLDAVLSEQARAAGFAFADPRQAFDGHGVCSDQEWINGPTAPLRESFHPNGDGQANGYLPAVDSVTG